ncbi:MAG: MBL fold metallo-hydrolase, partial [FCB group bacterium]|nr:MBL fold metallo-hydrolase [FCB group bacterium]
MFNKCKYIIICLIVSAAVSAADELTAHFLNVGHGDAIILQFPQGTVMLVDGGMPEYGEKVVDYLSDLGLSHYLDYIMLTHSHDDHVGRLNFILQNLTVGKELLSEYSEPTELYQRFIFLVDSLQIPQRIVSRGDVLEIDSLNMEIINPPAGKTLEALRGPNGASIAMKIDIGETDMLFMADVDKMTDMEIVNEYGKGLEAAVLKAAHHGSGVSST